MKKILVVFTGGTIGSTITDGSIDTSAAAAYTLIQQFQQHYPNADAIQFDILQPFAILSENLAPPAWTLIIDAINASRPDDYDGIIVTHGTDTLAYTAAALSFYFNNLNKPLLLVSSDYPLNNPNGNGLANFICAVEFIRQHIADGVFVPYRNAGDTIKVHQGSRLTCSLQLTGDFFSVRNQNFSEFDGQNFINTLPVNQSSPTAKQLRLNPNFSSPILLIKPYPGLDYNHFNLHGVKAVLHDLYHSGTACTTEQWGNRHSLIAFLKVCQQQEVPVYLAPAFKSENAYQSTRDLLKHGAEMLWNMSLEAAYVKLILAAGNFDSKQALMDFMSLDIAGEHICR
ncbi:MAG: asparaginase [Gammaproteobacteria bacterium]|nr:asparaginase [Gammaproteobacteria bacterium]